MIVVSESMNKIDSLWKDIVVLLIGQNSLALRELDYRKESV